MPIRSMVCCFRPGNLIFEYVSRECGMNIGKFPADMLERLLAKVQINDQRVLLGPKVGEDAALIDYGDKVLVAKTDPITFATNLIGWYAVQVNANDVACTGARPLWFLATLLVPETFTEAYCTPMDVTRVPGMRAAAASMSFSHTCWPML